MPESKGNLSQFIKAPVQETSQGGRETPPLLEGNKRSAFLYDYLRVPQEIDKKYPGYYQAEKAFTEEFIDHPDRFRPTEHAIKMAYADFVVRPSGNFCWPQDVGTTYPMDADVMRNVEVKVNYAHSSTLGGDAAIQETFAEVKQLNGSWEKKRVGGVAFILHDWIEKITDK